MNLREKNLEHVERFNDITVKYHGSVQDSNRKILDLNLKINENNTQLSNSLTAAN